MHVCILCFFCSICTSQYIYIYTYICASLFLYAYRKSKTEIHACKDINNNIYIYRERYVHLLFCCGIGIRPPKPKRDHGTMRHPDHHATRGPEIWKPSQKAHTKPYHVICSPRVQPAIHEGDGSGWEPDSHELVVHAS